MEFISVSEAARRIECARTTIYRACTDGRLNSERVAGRLVVADDDVFRDFEPHYIGARAARQKEDSE
jgi:excisionase family DNA binding protein